jgi:hypothetical protein
MTGQFEKLLQHAVTTMVSIRVVATIGQSEILVHSVYGSCNLSIHTVFDAVVMAMAFCHRTRQDCALHLATILRGVKHLQVIFQKFKMVNSTKDLHHHSGE